MEDERVAHNPRKRKYSSGPKYIGKTERKFKPAPYSLPYKPHLWKGTGFPTGLKTKLKYSEFFTMNSSGIAPASATYRGNSAFDPNFAVGGHQPLYYDQLAAIYNRYRVTGCKIKLTMSTPSVNPIAVVMYPTDEANINIADISSACERTWASEGTVNWAQNLTWKRYFDSAKVCGVSKQEYMGSDKYCPANTADPDEPWYIKILAQTTDQTTPSDLRVTACLTYYVTWSEPLLVAQS